MTAATGQAAIRHIVVALDASESGRPVVETAVRLAAILGARLEGVFIEDINLIRLAGLPFLRELRYWSLAEETFDTLRMQRELRTLARRAEQMLEQAARELGVPWSFQVWRGRAGAESLARAFAADILGVYRSGSLTASRAGIAPRPGMPRFPQAAAAVNVLFSDSQQAVRALTTACILARDMTAPLNVLLPAVRHKTMRALKAKARGILKSHAQTARFVPLADSGVQCLARAALASGVCVLIAEAGHPLLQQPGLDQCLDTLPCPVLLVR
ncbi:MAG: universal stress protein [Gammaproteobacteria bacterium]|jgi:nucleotide-binding universal stress UspA family protein